MLVLVACGGDSSSESDSQRNTPLPTATFTPRSTELPLVPTQVLIGSEDLPLKIAFVAEDDAETGRAANILSNALLEELDNFNIGFYEGLYVEVVFLDSNQQALDLLCNSTDTAVFVDAFTYMAARQQCNAQPAMQVELDGATSYNFELAVFDQRIFTLTDMRGYKFCAPSFDDLNYFVYPMLAFRAAGVDPLDDFAEIVTDYQTDEELVVAITGRYEPGRVPACEAAALPAGRLSELEAELVDNPDTETPLTQPQFNQVSVLEVTGDAVWEPIPYEVLVFPPDRLFSPALRQELITAVTNVADDEDTNAGLQDLLAYDALVPVEASDFDAFAEWLQRAGWNMADSPLN